MSFFFISFFFGWESLNNLWKDLVLRIYVENSKLFVCVSDAFFRQPRLMGFFFTFSTQEGPTNAYYFVILKVLLIYFGNLQHEKGFGFQSLKGDLLHASSWSSKGQLISKCLFVDFNFFQKSNENPSHSSKNKFICSFFGRIHNLTICFRN